MSEDPDSSTLTDLYTDHTGDFMGMIQDPRAENLNNFATALLPTDIGVTAQMVNPQDFAPGATIYYDVKLQNRGPSSVVLANYISPSRSLLAGAYAAEDITFVGSSTPGVGCMSAGPGSIAYWGVVAQDHPGYQLFICVDLGSNEIIAPGDSYTIRLQTTVNANPANNIGFYAVTNDIYGDPDMPTLAAAFTGSTEDVLDTLQNDNFARAMYPAESGGDNGSSGGNSGSGSGNLSSTGENIKRFAMLASILLLIGGSATVVVLVRKKRS